MELGMIFDELINKGYRFFLYHARSTSKPQRQNQIMNKEKTPTGECLKRTLSTWGKHHLP